MKKPLAMIVLFVLAAMGYIEKDTLVSLTGGEGESQVLTADTSSSSEVLARAFEQRLNDLQVRGQGVVVKVLSDDNKGSRHQRFILKLDNNQTLLVAHNIDLAPRVANLRSGDTVEFFGEYEWTERGGVIHWTHHDPCGRHVGGWLKHQGKTYE